MASPRPLYETSKSFTAIDDGTSLAVAGRVVDMSANPCAWYAVQATKGGSVTAWTLLLQGSLDGTNWFTIATHTNADPGDKNTKQNSTVTIAKKMRLNLTALTGAGTLDASVVALPLK